MGGQALTIRTDLPAAELRRLARREEDRAAAARLQAIAGALQQGASQPPTSPPPQEPSPMLAAANLPEQDLTPWMEHRLQLAVDIAGELQADAGRAVLQ